MNLVTKHAKKLIAALLLLLCCVTAATWAQDHTAPVSPPDAAVTAPYVVVNVGVDVPAIEKAAHDAAQATRELAQAVRTLSAAPHLSEEQKARAMQALQRVDELSSQVARSVERLPDAVRASSEPVADMAHRVGMEVRWTLVALAAAVLALVAGALFGLYALVLRPTQRLMRAAVGDFQIMARALERSAELVAQTNEAQLALAKTLAELTPARPTTPAGTAT
jgi:hypothetical protein